MSREKPLNSWAGEEGRALCKLASHVKEDHQEGHLLPGPDAHGRRCQDAPNPSARQCGGSCWEGGWEWSSCRGRCLSFYQESPSG